MFGSIVALILPLKDFGIDESEKKEFRKKSWIEISDFQNNKLQNAKELSFIKTEIKTRNSINRTSFTTDDSGMFAPYSIEEINFICQPVIYVMFDKKTFTKEQIVERLNVIGKVGFGKKGSIGKGHFKAEIDKHFDKFDEVESDYYMTLSPTILHKSKDVIEKAYYNTFNRFGKHHSSSTPFKKPLLMADSGAVVKFKPKKKREWIGGGIENGISTQSIVQGYSIVVPFIFERGQDG